MPVRADFPEKFQCLFQAKRYKVFYGGRGGAKSWAFARALLIQGAQKPLRILCTREVQKSIKDSVHKLLGDQIEKLGLSSFYEVLNAEIRGVNGSEILFSGLQDHTVESIKSYEGVDIVWVEEGQSVSKKSWDILIPTIRKEASEIWVSFNPSLDTDETWRRFVENPPSESFVIKVGWQDNPWFNSILEAERLHCKQTDPKGYPNIWEGQCKTAVDGAIYADEITEATEKGRICNVPYDPALKVHAIFDLGWNDAMAVVLVQKHVSELRVIEYLEDSRKTLDWWSAELKNKRYNWGKMWLPHDGAHKNIQTGKSAENIMVELGWDVDIVPNIAVELGIKQARMAFPRCYFDKEKTARLVQCLKRYRRAIPKTTGEPSTPVHDEWSHGADAFRYLSIVAPQLSNETWGAIKYPKLGIV